MPPLKEVERQDEIRHTHPVHLIVVLIILNRIAYLSMNVHALSVPALFRIGVWSMDAQVHMGIGNHLQDFVRERDRPVVTDDTSDISYYHMTNREIATGQQEMEAARPHPERALHASAESRHARWSAPPSP